MEACAKAPESHAGPRSGQLRRRANTALDRVLWTATGIALGAGIAIIAINITAEVWL